jgi:FMN phosphatase YigB (HAD superfamily)
MEKIQAILFDLGDTLSRSGSLSRAILNLIDSPVAQKLNLGVEQISSIGVEVDQYIKNLYREARLDQPDWFPVWARGIKNAGMNFSPDEVEHLCRAHLNAFVKDCKVEPYTIPLLRYLREAKIPLGSVSNVTGPADIFAKDFTAKGLAPFFSVVIWSAGVGVRKPNPRIFEIALEGLQLKPGKHIVMVGDNEVADIGGGKGMGFTTVKVDDRQERSDSAADYVVKRSEFHELIVDKFIDQATI